MNTNMQNDSRDLEQIMKFQQSLLRLVTRGTSDTKSNVPAMDQTRQLEDWVRKVHPKTI